MKKPSNRKELAICVQDPASEIGREEAFGVQYDVAGLIHLLGGRSAFNAKLDKLFVEQYDTSKFHFLDQFSDATGLVGQYAQGNEPSFHIPYLYDFPGQPWKAQSRVRQNHGCMVRRRPAGYTR